MTTSVPTPMQSDFAMNPPAFSIDGSFDLASNPQHSFMFPQPTPIPSQAPVVYPQASSMTLQPPHMPLQSSDLPSYPSLSPSLSGHDTAWWNGSVDPAPYDDFGFVGNGTQPVFPSGNGQSLNIHGQLPTAPMDSAQHPIAPSNLGFEAIRDFDPTFALGNGPHTSMAGRKRRAPDALDGDHFGNERQKTMRVDWDLGAG